jgi:hypothetical protein
MIKIETLNINIICDEHFDNLEKLLKKRIKDSTFAKYQKDHLTNNLNNIITNEPKDLEILWIDFKTKFKYKKSHKARLVKIFNYKLFSDKPTNKRYCLYNLADKLNINTCVYCNRQYTNTIEQVNKTGTKYITRPQFDHFLCQKEFPLFGLSFYNLVPSCYICNATLKRDKVFSCKTHFHPYVRGFNKIVTFNYKPKNTGAILGLNNDLEFKFDKTSQIADKNISAFQLKAIYKDSHQDYASEILYKIFKNNYAYLNSLRKTFHGTETIDDFYRIVFANYYDEKEFSKRPLSKLTRDIFDKYALLHKVK